MHQFLPNGQALLIRPAKPEDAPALLACFREITRETAFLLFTHAEAEALDLRTEQEFIRSFGDNSRHLLLLAEVDGDIAGTITVRQRNFQRQLHMGELGIALLHAYWNLGIGRRLMTAAMRWAEQHPELEQLYFSVLAHNEKAIQLYRNFGFLEYGRQPKGIKLADGTYGDLVWMQKIVERR
ncbi:GNAT family N-acetyltransferase [Chitinophaga agrisoli]|uniref:GNAT family N-acetyltransferase n=1 Tax=Chitinophaga agrisoli TaxID=2607653 RepID=A0A5B2VZL9_9BACT|nr:GNAT family N-acetyltransferase [Chitinophaga agrisoli]KAA2244505.1 GNAT family N-acetyltransferase [Chitinophaga agrisoli]